ncbi:MAG: hypothetical protein HY552_00465 [Elusimicrobia bacterium]|nr:hypothetical protein [Elusimicrobiota bacterium]
MEGVLITSANKKTDLKPKGSDIIISYLPDGDRLSYYYWDDWALSGLLAPGGHTLTLGIGGGAGLQRLARVDSEHRQTGVDLDLGPLKTLPPRTEIIGGNALHYVKNGLHRFDGIWIDLYDGKGGMVMDIVSAHSLQALSGRLTSDGLCFIHIFRPENRFYRYSREHDPFEPLLLAHLASQGYHASLFDRYASQTWVISRRPRPELHARLREIGSTQREPLRNWLLNYMLPIFRTPSLTSPREIGVIELAAALHQPVAAGALKSCGLSPESGVADWDAWSDAPLRLLEPVPSGSPRERLVWETLAVWTTAPGLDLPSSCRTYLARVLAGHTKTDCPELELRRVPIYDGQTD